MKILIKALILSLCFLASVSSAKIYQWKDANGVMHFTQTPPPVRAGKKIPKVTIIKQKISSRTYDSEGLLCGIMPKKTIQGDQLALLRELRMNMKSWKTSSIHYKKRYSELSIKSGVTSSGLEAIQKRIRNFNCMVSWAKKKIVQLEPLRLEFVKELSKVEAEYAAMKKREEGGKVMGTLFKRARNKKWKELGKLRARKAGLVTSN